MLFLEFNGWAYPFEPDNEVKPIYGPMEAEICGAYSVGRRGWIDFSCLQSIHTFCELGK